mgnify:CR=1 FL=1
MKASEPEQEAATQTLQAARRYAGSDGQKQLPSVNKCKGPSPVKSQTQDGTTSGKAMRRQRHSSAKGTTKSSHAQSGQEASHQAQTEPEDPKNPAGVGWKDIASTGDTRYLQLHKPGTLCHH